MDLGVDRDHGTLYNYGFNNEDKVMRGGSVNFTYEWEPPEDDAEPIELEVSATIMDYDPGCMCLRNGDPGYPPEGGNAEDIEVEFPDGTKMDPIPEELLDKLTTEAEERFGDYGGN